jgi:hypothetical protein
MLGEFLAYLSVPYIVVANKQDCEDAWNMEDIRNVLQLGDEVKFMPCVATEFESVRSVLLELMSTILAELDEGSVEMIVRKKKSRTGSASER